MDEAGRQLADAREHRVQAVRPGRAEMGAEPDLLEHLGRVVEDLLRRAVGVEPQQERDQAFDDEGIGIGADAHAPLAGSSSATIQTCDWQPLTLLGSA